MKVLWVNPCFLDYRVPVYAQLDALLGGGLSVVFSAARVRPNVRAKITAALGDRAIALEGERRLGLGVNEESFANAGLSIPYQPGLVSAIESAEADVIISEGFFQWTPASLWVKRRRRTALVIAYEKTPHTERNAPRLRTMYRRWVGRESDAICCNGQLSKEYCTDVLGVSPQRIVTGAMAADTEVLAAKCAALSQSQIAEQRHAFGNEGPLFLYVGRLIRLKGLREMLAGWQRYTHNGGAGTLVLVGDGPEREVLESTVRAQSIPRVIFAGKVNYDDIARCYAAADVLVMPTLEDNWSLVVPEAMACGKPIFCSQFNGCWPELVQPGVNGFVFDPNSTGEIAELLHKFASEPTRLSGMGAASRTIVADYTPAAAACNIHRAVKLAANANNGRAN